MKFTVRDIVIVKECADETGNTSLLGLTGKIIGYNTVGKSGSSAEFPLYVVEFEFGTELRIGEYWEDELDYAYATAILKQAKQPEPILTYDHLLFSPQSYKSTDTIIYYNDNKPDYEKIEEYFYGKKKSLG